MATGTALRRTLLSHRRISSAAGAHRPPAFEEVRASAGTHESRPFSSTALGLPGSARNWRSFSQLSSTQDADGYQGKGNLESKSYVAQIVNALRLGEREMASTLLSSLMSKKNCLISENFSYILDFCARAPDPLFAAETWRLLEENKIELDSQCWISIIKALCKGGYFDEAFGLLQSLGERHHSMIPMYNFFLYGCSRSRNWDQANRCLKLMDNHLIGKSEITYKELLKLAVRQKCPSLIYKIYSEFKKYYQPSILSLKMFVWAFSRSGELASACSTLRDMIALSVEGSTSLYSRGRVNAFPKFDIPIPCHDNLQDTGSSEDCVFPTVARTTVGLYTPNMESDSCCIKGDSIRVQSTTFHLSSSYIDSSLSKSDAFRFKGGLECDKKASLFPPIAPAEDTNARVALTRSFNYLIHACAEVRNDELAEKLFLQMLNLGLEPSASTYDGLVRAVLFNKGASYAANIVEEMRTKNIKPYNSTLEVLSIGFSRILELSSAEVFLVQSLELSSRSIRPFNALLTAYSKVDKAERGIWLLAKMKHFNIKPNTKTYEMFFKLFCNVNAPYEEGNCSSQAVVSKRLRVIEMDMIRNGLEHTVFTLENLIRALGSEGMIGDALRYLSISENMFSDAYPGTVTYNAVLHSLVEAKHNGVAIQIFNKMRSLQIPLDAATYNIILDLCSNLGFLRSAQSLMSLMIRDGFLPSACTYSTFMKILLENEDFDEALTLLDKLLSLGLEPDILFFNTVLEEACVKGHLNMVEFLSERMHDEKIRPDPSTCSHVFSAYLDGGFSNTAIEALQVLSMRMLSEEVGDLQLSKAMYESLICSEDPDVESWIVDIFSKSSHIGAALLNLRWCAILGLEFSWSPNESPWAQRLSARHGSGRCHP